MRVNVVLFSVQIRRRRLVPMVIRSSTGRTTRRRSLLKLVGPQGSQTGSHTGTQRVTFLV